MNPLLHIAIFAYPFIGALIAAARRRSFAMAAWFMVTAPLPALTAALIFSEDVTYNVPWLLMGIQVGLTETTRLFLLFTAALWVIAGAYSLSYTYRDPRRHRFFFFYLLTLSGNLGLIIARDIVVFYAFFALMTFAAYGLVVHDGKPEGFRAGRIYIIMAVLGEGCLLSALLMISSISDNLGFDAVGPAVAASEWSPIIIPLILAGFAVKAGIIPLHMWLPLAHPVAPTPASAVLSGTMIKAGLLGWMTWLPLGETAYPGWGAITIIFGFATAFYGALTGLTQNESKTNLAYSSISQMGVITVGLGIGLTAPDNWTVVAMVLAVYALNHSLAKGVLFMGVGVSRSGKVPRAVRPLIITGLALAALTIIGAPYTGGMLAKRALKYLDTGTPELMGGSLEMLLTLTAAGTTLLLTRFLFLVWSDMKTPIHRHTSHPGLHWIWIAGLAVMAPAAWYSAAQWVPEISTAQPGNAEIFASTWPMALGIVLFSFGARFRRMFRIWRRIPAGDIVVPLERYARRVFRYWNNRVVPLLLRYKLDLDPLMDKLAKSEDQRDLLSRMESGLEKWNRLGPIFILLACAIFLLLIL